MRCPSCKAELNNNQVRCFSCGMSLVGMKVEEEGAVENRPSYMRTQAEERQVHLIANIVISIVVGVIGLAIAAFIGFRYFGLGLPKNLNEAVNIQVGDFEVIEENELYFKQTGTTKKLVVTVVVSNVSRRPIKKLDINFHARSTEMQVWSSGKINERFSVVDGSNPLAVGDAATVKVEFPVLYSGVGLVKMSWNSEVVSLE